LTPRGAPLQVVAHFQTDCLRCPKYRRLFPCMYLYTTGVTAMWCAVGPEPGEAQRDPRMREHLSRTGLSLTRLTRAMGSATVGLLSHGTPEACPRARLMSDGGVLVGVAAPV
jgi:hypothetical protein